MKIFGNKKKSRHSESSARNKGSAGNIHSSGINGAGRAGHRGKRRTGRRLLVSLLILAILTTGVYALIKIVVRPPAVKPSVIDKDPNQTAAVTGGDSMETSDPEKTGERGEDEYTFVMVGTDMGSYNTDTIMVTKFNVKDGSVNVVSIPRDTMVNVSWAVKKVNTFYSAADGPQGVVEGLSSILGFKVDFYVVVDLEAFVKCVDAIGGVWYDVPMNMDYEGENISIHLQKGYQLLDGKKAIQFVRFRSGYYNADIGRIAAQQSFLKAAVEQILENKDKLSVTTLANVFLNYVDTDLTYGNLIWFGQQFFSIDSLSMSFQTLPGKYDDYVQQGGQNVSYVTILVDEWLAIVNECLNPFDEDITESDVSILTRDPENGRLYSTDGVYQGDPSWGN